MCEAIASASQRHTVLPSIRDEPRKPLLKELGLGFSPLDRTRDQVIRLADIAIAEDQDWQRL